MPCAFQFVDTLSLFGDTIGCQFEVQEGDLIQYDGKPWCCFHLPLQIGETASEKTHWDARRIEAFNKAIFERIDTAHAASEEVDLSGVVFPAGPRFEGDAENRLPGMRLSRAEFGTRCNFENVTFMGPVRFDGAKFIGGAVFEKAKFCSISNFEDVVVAGSSHFRSAVFCHSACFDRARFAEDAFFMNATFGHAEFRDAIFEVDAYFSGATFSGAAYFRPTTFKGDADFSGSSSPKGEAACSDAFPKLATFHRSRFGGRAVFINRRFLDTTVFGGVVFEVAPEFHNAVLHQDTSFSGTQFLDRKGARGVDAARAYRTLKLAMENVRARDEEARFYAYEQQSLRNRKDTARSIKLFSWLYEKTANYGQSFLRPLAWLLGTFATFLLIYLAALTDRTTTWADFESGLRFGLQQVFYPFAALRLHGSLAEAVGGVPLWLAFVAAAHSFLTITFLALFLLALRRRFKLD